MWCKSLKKTIPSRIGPSCSDRNHSFLQFRNSWRHHLHRLNAVEFASFQIFGGIIFLLIGIQFVFRGPASIEILRGESKHIAGSIAMPVLIGPGTISASIVIGKRHDPLLACSVVVIAVVICLLVIAILKFLHDLVHPTREALIERYIEIAGRITALYVGTVAIDMIMQGLRTWAYKF